MQDKKRVLSGIRATGRLHLGNYLGAVKGMLELQNNSSYETFYMVADLHTLTTPYNPETLKKNVNEVVLDYLACGLDPEKSTIFIQSAVPAHSELAFLFSTVMTVARMQHLPTFKDKATQYPENVTMALLNYPVLMAADILLYKADSVPVGIDQEPHLEISREVARKMNEKYGLNFPEPVRFETSGAYIPSLLGEGKMSKSIKGSFINLTDDLATIKERLARVPTDSGKGENVPEKGGVAVLFTLIELFLGKEKSKDYEKKYLGEGIRYSDLKDSLAEAIFAELAPIQEKRTKLAQDPKLVEEIIKKGNIQANKVAQETLLQVKKGMGIV